MVYQAAARAPQAAARAAQVAAINSDIDEKLLVGCTICLSAIILYIALITLVLNVISSLTITDPKFTIQSVSVSVYNVSPHEYPNSQITLEWNISFVVSTIYLCNTIDYYNGLNVTIQCLHGYSSSTVNLPRFRQHRACWFDDRKMNSFNATLHAGPWPSSIATYPLFEFDVNFQAAAKYKNMLHTKAHELLDVKCRDVKVGFLYSKTSGTMLLEPPACVGDYES